MPLQYGLIDASRRNAVANQTCIDAGLSQLKFSASGAWLSNLEYNLPTAPFGLPLRVQIQMTRGGACFEALYDAGGLKTNAGGVFQGAATQ